MAVTEYFFNASIAGPTDANGAWTSPANLFDGNVGTFATCNTSSANDLTAAGTTAPTSGPSISQVRWRFYINANPSAALWFVSIYTDSSFNTILNANNGTQTGYIGYSVLTTPVGGWTWSKLNGLAVLAREIGSIGVQIAIVQLEITYSDTPALGWLKA